MGLLSQILTRIIRQVFLRKKTLGLSNALLSRADHILRNLLIMDLYLARIAPALINEIRISIRILNVDIDTTLTIALFHNLILPSSKECRAYAFYRMLIGLENLVHILVGLEQATLGRPNIGLTGANRLRIKSMSNLNGSPGSRLRLKS